MRSAADGGPSITRRWRRTRRSGFGPVQAITGNSTNLAADSPVAGDSLGLGCTLVLGHMRGVVIKRAPAQHLTVPDLGH